VTLLPGEFQLPEFFPNRTWGAGRTPVGLCSKFRVIIIFMQAGFDVRRTYMDSAKYRNALHELVLNFTIIHPADRPAKLHLKFIDILTVLLQSGLDINDADYRLVSLMHPPTEGAYIQFIYMCVC